MKKFVFIPFEKYNKFINSEKSKVLNPKEELKEKQLKPAIQKETSTESQREKPSPPPGVPESPTGYRWLTLPQTN